MAGQEFLICVSRGSGNLHGVAFPLFITIAFVALKRLSRP